MKLSVALRLFRPAVWEFLHTRERRDEAGAATAQLAARLTALEQRTLDPRERAEQHWRLLSRRMPAGYPFRVVILVHNIAAWSSIASLHAAMRDADDFDPIVVSIPRCFGGGATFGEEEINHDGLVTEGVEHLRFTMPDHAENLRTLERLQPDVVLRQSQWDEDVPSAYSAESLSFARLALVPYEITNIVHNVDSTTANDTAVDEPLHRAAWRVYCADEDARAQAVRGAQLGASAWRALGHPKIDAITAVEPRWPLDREGVRRRIALSFHHTVATGWTDFGVFTLVADELLEWAAESVQDDFVLSPHPALEPTLRRTADGAALWERFRLRWDALPNTAVRAPQAAYLPVLAAADVIVTDGLSVLLEGQMLARPVIWWERAGHANLHATGVEIVAPLTVAQTTQEVRAAVDGLEADDAALALRRQRLLDRFGAGSRSVAAGILADMRASLSG